MPNRSRRPLLLSLAVALGLFATFLWFTQTGGGRPAELPEPVRPQRVALEPERAPETLLPPPVAIRYDESELLASTVLWPLRVELDLGQADYLPKEQGLQPIGSGIDAGLAGRILGRNDQGIRAKIRFVAGPNAGRVLETDVTGRFGATDLFPGLSIVEVSGSGTLGARREVRLRQGMEQLLNISFASPGPVAGRVQDEKGEPIEGADVTVDGIRTTTGPDGEFFLSHVAPGQTLVEVEHPAFVRYQELIQVAGGFISNRKKGLTFTLREGSTLRVAINANVGGPGPVKLYLLPNDKRRASAESYRNMRFPYHRLNPIEVTPGRPREITGLPSEVLMVHAFRPGAEPKLAVVNLRSGRPYDLKLQLKPAPMLHGTVTLDGEPAVGADVTLSAPNAVRAMLGYLKIGSRYLEHAVMPVLPPARQEVSTDKRGRFSFTAYEEITPTRYVEARGPEGRTWAGRLVRKGETRVDLELQRASFGDSALRIEMPGRWQGLPVEVLVDGRPLDPWVLPPNEDFRIDDLLAGSWSLRVSWHGEELLKREQRLRGETRLTLELPEACIEGQDEETWRRAGREFPGPTEATGLERE